MTDHAVSMLRVLEVCRLRGCSKAKLYQDIAKGLFPPPAKLGPKISVWPETDLINEQQSLIAKRDAKRAAAPPNAITEPDTRAAEPPERNHRRARRQGCRAPEAA